MVRAMRITAFWAKGYRSLADVHIDGLGPFNVFYGPNGAGKSNILAGMRTLFGLLAWRSAPDKSFEQPIQATIYSGSAKLLHIRDRSHFQQDERMILGARVEQSPRDDLDANWPVRKELMCEVSFGWFKRDLVISFLDWVEPGTPPRAPTEILREAVVNPRMQSFVYQVATHAYSLIDADRAPRPEKLVPPQNDVAAMLAAGKLKKGLFHASTHPNPMVRRRFRELQELLAGPPLHRPSFELVHDAQTGLVELMESTANPTHRLAEVPLHLAGLGIAQIYSILGQALLRGTDTVAIEEPEAHLHAPTSGIHLRHLLERLVTAGYLQQLFIATHSNLFDLDPTGYFDVSLDEQGATRIQRKPLSEIDRQHLYEPGPAKHALAEFLSYMDADTIAFRRPDGSPVTSSEMLDMLQRDDPAAVEFLRDVHSAAVRSVRVKHKKSPTPTEP